MPQRGGGTTITFSPNAAAVEEAEGGDRSPERGGGRRQAGRARRRGREGPLKGEDLLREVLEQLALLKSLAKAKPELVTWLIERRLAPKIAEIYETAKTRLREGEERG